MDAVRPRRSRGRGVRVLTLVAGLAVGTTAVGFAGSRWWVFDLVANLRTQLAVLLLALTLLSLAVRSREVAVVALVGTLVNVALLTPFLGGDPAPARPGADTLELTFFNTKRQGDLPALIDHLAEREDDLVVLARTDASWVEALEASDLDLHVLVGGTSRSG